MFRRRRSFSRSRKRSVAWIDGLSGFQTATPIQVRVLTFAVVNAAVPNTYGVAIGLTTDADLSLHGGEDAVIQRIRGRLLLYNGLVNAGAGPVAGSFFVRVVVAQSDITPAGATFPADFTTSAGLGRDDILWTRDLLVSGTAILGNGTGVAAETSTLNDFWFDVDVRAKRRLQSGRQLVLWFQSTALAAGTVPVSCTMAGGIRLLMKRPR